MKKKNTAAIMDNVLKDLNQLGEARTVSSRKDIGHIIINNEPVQVYNWRLVLGEKYSTVLTFSCDEWLEVERVYDIYLLRNGSMELSQSFRILENVIESDGEYKYKAGLTGKVKVR